METRELKLALHKIEAVILKDKRKFMKPKVQVGETTVKTAGGITYLRVMRAERRCRFREYIKNVVIKSQKKAIKIIRLLSNIRGAKTSSQRVTMRVVTSTPHLYG